MRSMIAILVLLATAIPSTAAIYTLQTARHTYYIDVRDQWYRDVYGAYVSVVETGLFNAVVTVQGPGIRAASGNLVIRPAFHVVNAMVRVFSYNPAVASEAPVLETDPDAQSLVVPVEVVPRTPRDARRAAEFHLQNSAE